MIKRAPVRAKPRASDPALGANATADSRALKGNSLIELITLQWQRQRGDLDLFNFLLAIYFMRLGTLVDRTFGRMCQKRFGISGPDMRVMFALRRGGHPYTKRPTDLFRALLVTSGAMTKKVDRLASMGMVERQPDPSYNGGFLIRLTRNGLRIVEEAIEQLARESAIAPAMMQFTAAERAAGNRFCLLALASMEASDERNSNDVDANQDAPAAVQSGRRVRGR